MKIGENSSINSPARMRERKRGNEYRRLYEELIEENKALKEKVINVKSACYCELCYDLEKQNRRMAGRLLFLHKNITSIRPLIEDVVKEIKRFKL